MKLSAFIQPKVAGIISYLKEAKVNQSPHRSGGAMRVPAGLGFKISRQPAMKVISLSALRTGRLYLSSSLPPFRRYS
jgi:hypothetical protein